MDLNPDAPVFNNWTVVELESEMMECYSHIVSTTKKPFSRHIRQWEC